MNKIDVEKQAIGEVVNQYFTSTYHGNAALMREIFHPDARVIGSFQGQILDLSLDDFITRVCTPPTAATLKEKYNKEILLIDHVGDAAMVKARVVIKGNIFTDYISLLKIDGRWVIRNKSFST